MKINHLIATTICVTLAAFGSTGMGAPGDLDPTFGVTGKVTTDFGHLSSAHCIAIQTDGKILLAGSALIASNYDFAMARYNEDGGLDTSFNGSGKVTTSIGPQDDTAYSIAVQNDGKIVLAGVSTDASRYLHFALARYNQDGSLDETFSHNGKVVTDLGDTSEVATGLILQSDGRMLVGGGAATPYGNTSVALRRYKKDGKLDIPFGGLVNVSPPPPLHHWGAFPAAMAVQSDGRILLAGNYQQASGDNDIVMVRYNSDGTWDSGFNRTGKVTTDIGTIYRENDGCRGLAVQRDDKILVTGQSYSGSTYDVAIVRYKSNGPLDPTFDGTGKVTTSFTGYGAGGNAIALQSDRRILVAGYASAYGDLNFAIVRYLENGSIDETFGGSGRVTTSFGFGGATANAMAVQKNGRILVAGTANEAFALARYEAYSVEGDALISNNATDNFVGDDIINPTGQSQVAIARVARASTKAFTVKVQNESQNPASFRILGTAKSAGFGVNYFDDIGTDITAEVVAGTYEIADLAAGAEKSLTVGVTVKSSVPDGTVKTCTITVRPAVGPDSTRADTVRARVTAK